MRALRVVLLSGLLVAVGCRGSSRASTTSTPAPTAATAATTTTTRATPAASTTATTLASTTVPSASASTSTTTPVVSVEEQVRAAAKQAYADYRACLREPPTCDPAKGYLPGSDAAQAFARTLQQMLAGGWYFGPDADGYQVIESVEQKADHVLVVECQWTTAWMYGPPATAGGDPIVQRNDTGWGREASQFVQGPAGAWLLRRVDGIDESAGVNKCPPKQ